MQGHEITTGALAKLLDITPKTIADLESARSS
jgi:DNA-binding XRE family transcriptional regulator